MTPRTFISLALVLVLVLTSQAMAQARGASDPTGQMVLCIGGKAITVYTDAEGAPTAAPHICPDCVTLLAFNLDAPFGVPQPAFTAVVLSQRPSALPVLSAHRPKPQTRAPPFPV